ncbi:MAG: serine kinase [bacterium]
MAFDAAAHVRGMRDSFQELKERGKVLTSHYRIAGKILRVEWGGKPTADACRPALAHLESAADPHDLTVAVWDGATSGGRGPEFPLFRDSSAPGEIFDHHSEDFDVAFHRGDDTALSLDRKGSEGFYWVPDAREAPYYDRASPLKHLLQWWFIPRGSQIVHAGAVGTEKGAVLIVGKSGSGKSTTSLAALKSPLSYVGDDYCLVSFSGVPRVHSLYNSGKLCIDNLHRFPDLEPLVSNRHELPEEKAMFFLYPSFKEKLVESLPLMAVLIPRITGRAGTSLNRTSGLEALKALAPSTLLQLPGAGERGLKALGELIRKVPVYRLNLGNELDEVTEVLREWIDRGNA